MTCVDAGCGTSFCVDDDGQIWVFGRNYKGSLGIGRSTESLVPRKIAFTRITSISVGNRHTICLNNFGKVFSFGSGSYGRLGLGDCRNKIRPCLIESLNDKPINSIYCGAWHSFCIDINNNVYSFGYNHDGQLGFKACNQQLLPRHVDTLSDIIEIACGNWHTIFLSSTGKVYGVGRDNIRKGDIQDTPIELKINHNIISIACGSKSSYFLTDMGVLFSLLVWTENKTFEIVNVDNLEPIKSMFAKENIFMIITINGSLYYSIIPKTEIISKLQPFHDLTGVLSVGLGENHAIIQTVNGIFVTGKNSSGELGIGKTSQYENDLIQLPEEYSNIIKRPFIKQKSARK